MPIEVIPRKCYHNMECVILTTGETVMSLEPNERHCVDEIRIGASYLQEVPWKWRSRNFTPFRTETARKATIVNSVLRHKTCPISNAFYNRHRIANSPWLPIDGYTTWFPRLLTIAVVRALVQLSISSRLSSHTRLPDMSPYRTIKN